jgi:hypothetical protein
MFSRHVPGGMFKTFNLGSEYRVMVADMRVDRIAAGSMLRPAAMFSGDGKRSAMSAFVHHIY